ncbi:MAG: pyridoxamine 5'-phosphate oxidase family protein [Candidatus Hermodarchaeota archaeon]
MTLESKTFDFVEKEIRKKQFGILSTISPKEWAQSSGVHYGVSPKALNFALYILTDSSYKKVQNIQKYPRISFAIPYPHYYLRFIPPGTISFQGTAEILPFEDSDARKSYTKSSQRRMIRYTEQSAYKETAVFLKIKPNKRISCFGLGVKLSEMMKDPEAAHYSVLIPSTRL